jgi:hypothetical protein
MLANKIRVLTLTTVFAAFAFTTSAFAQDAKVPETAADHEAMAKSYKEKADGYRKDAEWHKQMLESYKKTHMEGKSMRNPFNVKMEKHCAAMAKDAEKLAADADKAAEYHTLRAKEMQGK